MEQHDILLKKLEKYLIVSLLLMRAERFGTVEMRFSGIVQAPHLPLISDQELTVDEAFDDSRRAMTAVHQLVAGNVDRLLATDVSLDGVPMRERQIVDEHLLLAGGTRQHIERHMQGLLVFQVVGQSDINFCLGFIAVFRLHA